MMMINLLYLHQQQVSCYLVVNKYLIEGSNRIVFVLPIPLRGDSIISTGVNTDSCVVTFRCLGLCCHLISMCTKRKGQD